MEGLLAWALLIGLPTDESGAGEGGGSKLGEPDESCCGTDNDPSGCWGDAVLVILEELVDLLLPFEPRGTVRDVLRFQGSIESL